MTNHQEKRYEATYLVFHNNGSGYSGPTSEKKRLQVKADDMNTAYDRTQKQLAIIRKRDSVQSVTLERLAQIGK